MPVVGLPVLCLEELAQQFHRPASHGSQALVPQRLVNLVINVIQTRSRREENLSGKIGQDDECCDKDRRGGDPRKLFSELGILESGNVCQADDQDPGRTIAKKSPTPTKYSAGFGESSAAMFLQIYVLTQPSDWAHPAQAALSNLSLFEFSCRNTVWAGSVYVTASGKDIEWQNL
ncbi:MAG TPA: hypothetical protein VER03_22485 [Bryobacteraceae bacterium]|nr:hypothetical protein [Bryobacteraceae bacterium]